MISSKHGEEEFCSSIAVLFGAGRDISVDAVSSMISSVDEDYVSVVGVCCFCLLSCGGLSSGAV